MSGAGHDVGGVRLARPFRIRRLGHFGYNVEDIAACLEFYCEWLGFRVSDPHDLAKNHPQRDALKALGDTNLYFIRHGTDHHSFVLFNRHVFNALGRGDDVPARIDINQMTWQVGSLAEVSGAIDYFDTHGIAIGRVGRDMPGSNWHVYPYDPEGHRNELYYGKPHLGTSKFHAYATACIVSHGQRYTLALSWVRRHETTVTVLKRLIARIRVLGLRIKVLLMDRAFFNLSLIHI